MSAAGFFDDDSKYQNEVAAAFVQGGKKKPLKAPKKDSIEFEEDKDFKQKQAQIKKYVERRVDSTRNYYINPILLFVHALRYCVLGVLGRKKQQGRLC